MLTTDKALSKPGWEDKSTFPGGPIYKSFSFGEGYELTLEPLLLENQFYLALYKEGSLLLPEKVCVKKGKGAEDSLREWLAVRGLMQIKEVKYPKALSINEVSLAEAERKGWNKAIYQLLKLENS